MPQALAPAPAPGTPGTLGSKTKNNGRAKFALEDADGNTISTHASKSAAQGALTRQAEKRLSLVELLPDGKPVKAQVNGSKPSRPSKAKTSEVDASGGGATAGLIDMLLEQAADKPLPQLVQAEGSGDA
jgi:hypothetical protein